jgi:hypothetical protein
VKRVALALTSLALAAPTAASAAHLPAGAFLTQQHFHRCSAALRADAHVWVRGTSCAAGRGLERYVNSHESLDGPFRYAGHTWRGYAAGIEPSGHELFHYSRPGVVVYVETRHPES